jgi:hypothetical protein
MESRDHYFATTILPTSAVTADMPNPGRLAREPGNHRIWGEPLRWKGFLQPEPVS